MSDNITIARPYAKAIFEQALANDKLKEWSAILYELAFIVVDENAEAFINNPATQAEQQIALLLAPFSKSQQRVEIDNLMRLLAQNKRFMVLPAIHALFEVLRAEQEKNLVVDVRSFAELSNSQAQQLKDTLSQRLQRQVTLQVKIDKSLLGGAVIQAGDLVIDGSVRGQLNKLGASIAA